MAPNHFQRAIDFLLPGLGAGGLADMKGASVLALVDELGYVPSLSQSGSELLFDIFRSR